MIGPIMFAAPDTGMAACIMSGSPVTGHGEMVRKCGSTAITSHEAIKPFLWPWRAMSAWLPTGDQSTQQTENSADEGFRKIMAL